MLLVFGQFPTSCYHAKVGQGLGGGNVTTHIYIQRQVRVNREMWKYQ